MLIFEVLETASLPEMKDDWEPGEDAHELVKELYHIWDNLSQRSITRTLARRATDSRRGLDLFSHGIIDLNTRAQTKKLPLQEHLPRNQQHHCRKHEARPR